MAWFFVDAITSKTHILSGENAAHIAKSLRMKKGETLTLCTKDGRRHECEIEEISKDEVKVTVISSTACEQEPDVELALLPALMKGDSMDDVIQKAVELGVSSVTPILTARCISRPDEKTLLKKQARWQKIADNAASQARRGIIPQVRQPQALQALGESLRGFDKVIVFYECGGEPLRNLVSPHDRKIALITGAEGGFEESEIERLVSFGAKTATLGKRILRARTAPIAAVSAVMLLTGNLE